ncbi:MAG: tryptophan 7-halogenase [Trichormus sp. ATA11-4-KO1]|jgi:flavin-dependent dehydrogenase|nr:tryptophan 7-halogenase [Trichormus sp. ATA11-4-KO1]
MMMLKSIESSQSPKLQDTYDVVVCGGGLAGMTLARQLRLKMPHISILVCDRLVRPLPVATFKVGESTVEIGSFYFAEVLHLTDYIQEHHLMKLGLRFFLGNSQAPLQKRPELGVADFNSFHSKYTYQLDRGIFENDLRDFNVAAGIDLLENCSVQDIEMRESDEFHTVIYKKLDTKQTQIVKARWVVDATGHRRLLQKKLDLAKPNSKNRSAVWFRINKRLDVSDLVPVSESQWHARVPNNLRYHSTNHLVGDGYWVWLIPLSSGYTSLGIVASDDVHNFQEYNTYEKAYKWLQKYEPALANYLKDEQPNDFMKMPKYSHSSTQVYSLDRWACVGVAGTFVDPLYSPGSDMIALANTLTTELIRLDLSGQLTQKMVDHANQFYLKINDQLTSAYEAIYQLLGKSSLVFTLQFVWGAMFSWATITPLIFNSSFLDPESTERFQHILSEFSSLSQRVEQLFLDWANKPSHRLTFEFLDYLAMLPFVDELRSNLKSNKTEREVSDDYVANLKIMEELAQVIFLLALEDTMPEKLTMFSSPVWLNAWAISLDDDRWEHDGLFQPKSQPRDLHQLMEPLRKNIRWDFNQSVPKIERETIALAI